MSASPEIRFYHLERSTLEQALAQLLPRIHAMGHRIVLQCTMPERLKALDTHLWSFSREAFLPHGSEADGHAEDQPIWLTCGQDTPNGADILVLCDGAERTALDGFAIICDLFDGLDGDALQAARNRWKAHKDAGHALTYWQQGQRGGWEKKATANMPDADDAAG